MKRGVEFDENRFIAVADAKGFVCHAVQDPFRFEVILGLISFVLVHDVAINYIQEGLTTNIAPGGLPDNTASIMD